MTEAVEPTQDQATDAANDSHVAETQQPDTGEQSSKPNVDGLLDTGSNEQQPDQPAGTEGEEASTEGQQEEQPIEYSLEVPEGALLSNVERDEVLAFAQEHKLPNEVAQQILEREDKAMRKLEAVRQGEWDAGVAQWKDQLANDPNLAEKQETYRRVLSEFADEEFINDLKADGLEYHPGFIRFVTAVGKRTQGGNYVPAGNSDSGQPLTREDKASRWNLSGT